MFPLLNKNLSKILAAFDNIIPSSCQVFCEHSSISLPTSPFIVRSTKFRFVCSPSPGILFFQSCYINIFNYVLISTQVF